MSWNPVIKGYNAILKLITRGYGGTGVFVKFCAVRAVPHVRIKLRTN